MILIAAFLALLVLALLVFGFFGLLFPNPQLDLFRAIEEKDPAAIKRAIDEGADPNKPGLVWRTHGRKPPTAVEEAAGIGDVPTIIAVIEAERCSWFGLFCDPVDSTVTPRSLDRAPTPEAIGVLDDFRRRQRGDDPSPDPTLPVPSERLFASLRLCLSDTLRRPAMVQALLVAGADPNSDCGGPLGVWTPVHKCAKYCAVINTRTGAVEDRTDSLRLLIEAGGDLERRSGYRSDPENLVLRTPLLSAVSEGGPADAAMLLRVRALLELGADATARMPDGKDAVALVREQRYGDRHDVIIAELKRPRRPATE